MKRNGLVFVPREPPKRIILYPAQDIASQQLNGLYTRAKTDLITNNHNETIQQSNNNVRLSRQQLLSSPLNSNNDGTITAALGHSTTLSAGQKVQNPYYANPFFRPKIITNQQLSTITNTNLLTPNPDCSTANRGRPPIHPKIPSPFLSPNVKVLDSETTVITSLTQDDNGHWAHSVTSSHITTNNDTVKQKGSSTTDIVLSLLDTSRAPINSGSAPTSNLPTRNDSTTASQTLTASEPVPGAPPFSLVDISSTANQNWRKALVADFQKNYRNIPTVKLLYAKPLQSSNNEQTTVLNGINHERTIQVNENTPLVSSSIHRSTESLLVTKQDTNYIERSTSLQIQKSTSSNPTTTNTTEEIIKPIETSNSDHVSHKPISIPSALLTAKPPVNVEQQRANITRVMIRRDFVKSTESKPPMPIAANMRSLMTSQSAKNDSLPVNNVIRVATISENPNSTYPLQQQTMPLSQKSLLSFTSNNAPMKESLKIDNNNQRKLNETMIDGIKTKTSQIVTNNGSVDDEARRKREEINNKTKRRAASASIASNYE